MKVLIRFLLVFSLLFAAAKPSFAVVQCRGTVSTTFPTCDESYVWVCAVQVGDVCHFWVEDWSCTSGSSSSNDACSWVSGVCLGQEPQGVSCNTSTGRCVSNNCPGGSGNTCPSTSGCWTCDDAVCQSGTTSCSTPCGSTTESCRCTNLCGGTNIWTRTVGCNECEDCFPACGQARDCGGTCANTDAVIAAPTIISPNGSDVNPTLIAGNAPQAVTLSWNAVTNAESYVVGLYNSAGTLIWNPSGITSTSITTAALSSGVYYWGVRAVNDTCTVGQTSGLSALGYFRINSSPTITNLVIRNSDGTAVAVETGNRNHICQSSFTSATQARQVRFEATLTDADGWADIASAQLQWNGSTYNLNLAAGSGTSRLGTVMVDYTGVNNGRVYMINGIANDPYTSSGWVAMNRSWKVWDCQVPVMGTVYDGSAGQACNNTGFTVLAGANMGLSRLIYDGNADVEMTLNPPANYGTNNVIWGQNYLPLFNNGSVANPEGDLAATGRFTRIIDLGVGTTACPSAQFNIGNNISAYSANPRAQIDFSFIQDQLSWFQVSGGGVRAANALRSGVPVTADVTNRALSLAQVLASNGFVSFSTYTNTNGFNDNSAFGIPNNWWKDRDLLPNEPFNYQYFYSNYWERLGLGKTGTSWDQRPARGVFLVNGNLNINSDFVLAGGEFFMVVSSGSITIDPTVNRLDGVYIADVDISGGGLVTNQLLINGMLYARGNIRFNRSFSDASQNNTVPAVLVNYQPELIFTMPPSLTRVMSGWREE